MPPSMRDVLRERVVSANVRTPPKDHSATCIEKTDNSVLFERNSYNVSGFLTVRFPAFPWAFQFIRLATKNQLKLLPDYLVICLLIFTSPVN